MEFMSWSGSVQSNAFSNKYRDRGDLFEGRKVWEAKSLSGEYALKKL